MSIQEILHRIDEQIKRLISRFYIPKSIYKFNKYENLPIIPGIKDGLKILSNNNLLLYKWKELANTSLANQFYFLGMKWPKNVSCCIWHLDPVSKKQWPANVYCFSINYRNTNEYGDVKYVWEINRLQYLQPLAALAAITKDDSLSRHCISEIENWIDHNPCFQGVNWTSGIELACRLVSILVVVSFVDHSLISTAQSVKIHKTLALHGYWLMRYPSKFSSANNHLITEAGALYFLGKLAPFLPNANKWCIYGKKTLTEEVLNQIHEDGVGAEQSPSYTAFTLEWLLLCGLLGKRLGDDFPSHYWQRIENAGEFLRWITDKNGNQPHIGDDDEGILFYSPSKYGLYTTSILATLATVTKRKDIASPIKISHLRDAYFGKTYDSPNALTGAKCFKTGGYTISRSLNNGKEVILITDHGPLGYLSISAHGHADTLSIWLHIDGIPVIVDAGTYLYHSGGSWRQHMRSTAAHNTLTINGTSSSNMSSAFNWSTKAKASLLSFQKDKNKWNLVAEHNGYKKKFNVIHRRSIEMTDVASIKITDNLHGEKKQLPIDIGFLIHPSLEIKNQNSCWLICKNNVPILKIEQTSGSLHESIQRGEKNPTRGWYSSAFGIIEKTSRLSFNGIIETNDSFQFSLTPIF